MPTKYDVFTGLIEHAPCKAKDLHFKTPVYMHIKALIKMGWIKEVDEKYVPIKNKNTIPAFKIVKYCLKNGLNYNKFFSKNIADLIMELFQNAPNLRPKKIKGNKEYTELLKYFEKNQFSLITKKRPRRGIMLKHQIFDLILSLKGIKTNLKTIEYLNIKNEVLKLKSDTINPFGDNIFSFLSGSAQLEGATITAGETKDLIINEVYPEKPQKDIQMVKNLNEAMHYVFEHLNDKISVEYVKEINRLVMFSLHRNAGKYKITHNKIQGNPSFKTAHPNKVPQLMQEYCQKLQKIKNKDECLQKLGYIHNELQYIHPFADGNSRTTRMILNWVLLKYNIPLLVLKMGCFDEYMSLTKLAKKRVDEKLTKLFYHLLLHESLLN